MSTQRQPNPGSDSQPDSQPELQRFGPSGEPVAFSQAAVAIVTTARASVETAARAEPSGAAPERPDREFREAAPPAEPAGRTPAVGPTQIARVLATIVAPTTLLTALLYYFGWMHVYYFFDYFGVSSTVLGFGTVDYLIRSVDALFVPITAAALAGLFALWGHVALRAHLGAASAPAAPRLLVPVMTAGGLILAAVGGFSTFLARTLLTEYVAAAPLCFALGVLLLAYTANLRRFLGAKRGSDGSTARGWVQPVEWVIAMVLVSISLFAAATDYAAAVGRSRAHHLASALSEQPNVVVYSSQSLSLRSPGVREMRCEDPQAAYRFRYDGLKLVLQSGDQYLFLPVGWTPSRGTAILIPRSSSVRLEFSPSASRGPPSPSC